MVRLQVFFDIFGKIQGRKSQFMKLALNYLSENFEILQYSNYYFLLRYLYLPLLLLSFSRIAVSSCVLLSTCFPTSSSSSFPHRMGLVMRNRLFAYVKTKRQISCAADQRLCFRYTGSTIPLLYKSEISSL